MITVLKHYAYLMRLHKPIGMFLLLWPTLWGLWLAGEGDPQFKHVIIFILGVVIMRSAGCVINDIADKDVDPHVARTRERPLAANKIPVSHAIGLFIVLLGIAFFLVLQLPGFVVGLAFVGAALTLVYPFLKRITHLPQLGLGLAFAWGVPMAFAAEQNALPGIAWIAFIAAAIWPLMYDTLYAMTDMQDDIKIGVKSTAILVGKNAMLFIAALQLLFLICMVVVGVLGGLHWPFYLSLLASAGCFGYQIFLMKAHDPQKCFRAFMNNQWVGLIIFVGIMTSYIT